MDETEDLCDEIAILHNGKVLKHGTPEQLRDSFSKEEEIIINLHSKKYTTLMAKLKNHKKSISSMKVENGKLVIRTRNAEPVLVEVLRTVDRLKDKLLEVDVRKASLGEVFESLVRKGG